MDWQPISKPAPGIGMRPNLGDYERERDTFSWDVARRELDGLPGGRGLNIAHEAIDRHVSGPLAERLAIRCLGRHGEVRDFSYRDLHSLTNRFANVLRRLGVGQGDRVFALAGRIPELYISALGTLKNGSVFSPLFSAFGPEPIRQRLALGGACALVTTETLYRRKVAELRSSLPALRHVLLVGANGGATDIPARSTSRP